MFYNQRGVRQVTLFVAGVISLFTVIFLARGTFVVESDSQSKKLLKRAFCSESDDKSFSSFQRGAAYAAINAKLFGPDSHGGPKCPVGCGCFNTPTDCPRWYTIEAVEASAAASGPLMARLMTEARVERTYEAAAQCGVRVKGYSALTTGGWCLAKREPQQFFVAGKQNISIAMNHVPPSTRIVKELGLMIEEEGIRSINDFGAGVGQYKAALVDKFPQVTYLAYDGAGNIGEFTNGFLQHFDLTMPLHLPKADWVMSLEVGEHVPSKYEGMMIRNLHRHNCKGVILSWGVLGQGGHKHQNMHSNEYVIKVFKELGYTHDAIMAKRFRNPVDNFGWFRNSVMVFRRITTVC